MPEMKLTEKRIHELKPPTDRAYERYWDTEVTGLAVKVLRSGRKVYYFKDRLNGRFIYGKSLPRCSERTLAEMRDDAFQWKAQIRRGENPWKVTSTLPAALTVYELCLENLKAKGEKELSVAHLGDMERLVERLRDRKLSKMSIDEITVRDASEFLERYHGREKEHDRLRWFLANCFQLAIKKGLLPMNSNPWLFVDKRYELPDPSELPRFTDDEIATLAEYLRRAERGETKNIYSLVWIQFMRFLMRNGTRPSETRVIRRSWIKDINGHSVIDHPRTKTGRKIIHLSPDSLLDIGNTPRGDDWLFPGRGTHLVNYAKPYSAFCREAGLSKPPYAIRRWYASTGRRVYQGDIKPIQDLCGWETEEMALRYAGDDDEMLERMIMANAETCRRVASRVNEVVSG